MQDRVADVLAQREALDRESGASFVISLVLHAAVTALAVYAATHADTPTPATMVNIQFANMPSSTAPSTPRRTAVPPATPAAPAANVPKIEDPKPKIEEPKPAVPADTPKPEKNTVPLSPFGRSTKKGSESPAPPPQTAPAPAGVAPSASGGPAGTTADVPVGGAGVTGLEGGDFPYSLYIDGMQRRIGSNWFRPQVAPGTETVIYFRITRDGTISEAKIQKPSGNSTFDRAALSSVRSSNPLNPLPFGYNGSYLGVHLTFR